MGPERRVGGEGGHLTPGPGNFITCVTRGFDEKILRARGSRCSLTTHRTVANNMFRGLFRSAMGFRHEIHADGRAVSPIQALVYTGVIIVATSGGVDRKFLDGGVARTTITSYPITSAYPLVTQ